MPSLRLYMLSFQVRRELRQNTSNFMKCFKLTPILPFLTTHWAHWAATLPWDSSIKKVGWQAYTLEETENLRSVYAFYSAFSFLSFKVMDVATLTQPRSTVFRYHEVVLGFQIYFTFVSFGSPFRLLETTFTFGNNTKLTTMSFFTICCRQERNIPDPPTHGKTFTHRTRNVTRGRHWNDPANAYLPLHCQLTGL